jgi:hypothetical protein
VRREQKSMKSLADRPLRSLAPWQKIWTRLNRSGGELSLERMLDFGKGRHHNENVVEKKG